MFATLFVVFASNSFCCFFCCFCFFFFFIRLTITTSIFVYSYKIEWLHTKCRCCELANEEQRKKWIGNHSEEELTHAMYVLRCCLIMLHDCLTQRFRIHRTNMLHWFYERCNLIQFSILLIVHKFELFAFPPLQQPQYIFNIIDELYSLPPRFSLFLKFIRDHELDTVQWFHFCPFCIQYREKNDFHSAKINIYGCAIVDMT